MNEIINSLLSDFRKFVNDERYYAFAYKNSYGNWIIQINDRFSNAESLGLKSYFSVGRAEIECGAYNISQFTNILKQIKK